jgi:hypothetical protein
MAKVLLWCANLISDNALDGSIVGQSQFQLRASDPVIFLAASLVNPIPFMLDSMNLLETNSLSA